MGKVDLFFCGDSFTWGEELQGPEQNHRKRERERFSGVLAKRLKLIRIFHVVERVMIG